MYKGDLLHYKPAYGPSASNIGAYSGFGVNPEPHRLQQQHLG